MKQFKKKSLICYKEARKKGNREKRLKWKINPLELSYISFDFIIFISKFNL